MSTKPVAVVIEVERWWPLEGTAREVDWVDGDGPPVGTNLYAHDLSKATLDVLEERVRQIRDEGWSQHHDDERKGGELARAAACYALHTEPVGNVGDYLRFWPWDSHWWKPSDRRRNLVKAGALILAEIEKLDREKQ